MLRDLIRLDFPQIRALSFSGPEDEGIVKRILLGSQNESANEDVTPSELLNLLQACLRVAVGTPLKKEKNAASFEQTIRAPYRTLVSQLTKVKKEMDKVGFSQLREAVELTLRLLRAKGFTKEESLILLRQALSNPQIESKLPEYFSS